MPDIAMCTSDNGETTCPVREKCYRFKAIPNEYRQTYFSVAPFKTNEECQYQMEYYPKDINGKIIKK